MGDYECVGPFIWHRAREISCSHFVSASGPACGGSNRVEPLGKSGSSWRRGHVDFVLSVSFQSCRMTSKGNPILCRESTTPSCYMKPSATTWCTSWSCCRGCPIPCVAHVEAEVPAERHGGRLRGATLQGCNLQVYWRPIHDPQHVGVGQKARTGSLSTALAGCWRQSALLDSADVAVVSLRLEFQMVCALPIFTRSMVLGCRAMSRSRQIQGHACAVEDACRMGNFSSGQDDEAEEEEDKFDGSSGQFCFASGVSEELQLP